MITQACNPASASQLSSREKNAMGEELQFSPKRVLLPHVTYCGEFPSVRGTVLKTGR